MNKIRVGILFGGKSAEHEISLLSAKNVIDALDKNKYEAVLI
ncbi:MAG: D-alanine--D-alanine ligase A, partial [Gammaproteobacteria bacterium]|nr:D-alanine--D-alanine ligase A [Gammaproteobacteria bacterium]